MANNKKITFEGVDNGVFTLMDKYRQTAEKTYQELLRDAKALNIASSDQIKLIQSRVKELEKENRLRLEATKLELSGQYARLSQNATPNQRRALLDDMRGRISEAGSEFRQENMMLSVLKEILDEMKTAEANNKKNAEDEKKQRQEQISQINDQWETRKSLWEQELSEDPEGVRKNIRSKRITWFERAFMGKRGDFEGSEYDQEKLTYQRNRQGEKEKEPESFFGALLKMEILKSILRSAQGMVGAMSNAQSGDQLLNQMVGEIPFIGPFLSMPRTRMIDEQFKAQVPLNKLMARTGNSSNMFSVENAGFSISETMPIAEQVALAKGSGKNNEKDTINSILLERAFAIDRGVLNQMFSSNRLTNNPNNIVQTVALLMNQIPSLRADRTQLQEILTLQNTLIEQQSQIVERVNPESTAQVIAAFRDVGGSFSDTRANSRIASINNALSNPSNDFQKARNFGVLSKLNPGGNYFNMLEMQEQGINQPGFLSETLKQLEKEFGGGPAFMLAVKQRLGLSATSTRQLVGAYQKNRSMFDNITGTSSSALKDLGIDLSSEAGGLTSERERETAMISDAFVKGAVPGLRMAGKLMAEDFVEALKNTKVDIGPFNLGFGWAGSMLEKLVPNGQ